MKRTYEVTVTLRSAQAFHRKRRGALVRAEALRGVKPPAGWTLASVRVRSKAVREPGTAPGPSTERRAIGAAVVRARAILEEVRRASPRAPRASIRWYTAGCGRISGYSAHIHAQRRGTRATKPTKDRPYRWIVLPRNTICIHNLGAWAGEDRTLASTIAHELAHAALKRSGKGHRSRAFKAKTRELYEAWKAYRAPSRPADPAPVAPGPEPVAQLAPLDAQDVAGLEVNAVPAGDTADHHGV
jgi:hypothetical protein